VDEAMVMADSTPETRAIALEELWDRMRSFKLFETFDPAQERDPFLLYLAENSPKAYAVRDFSAGEFIARKNDYLQQLCIILSGEVTYWDSVRGEAPRRSVTFRAGDFFNEDGFLSDNQCYADIKTDSKCQLLFLGKGTQPLIAKNEDARKLLNLRYRASAVRDAIGDLPLLQGALLPFQTLIHECEIAQFSGGTRILNQGELCRTLYIIRRGFVQEVEARSDGTKRIIAYLRRGDFFGEEALIKEGATIRFSAISHDLCELIAVPHARILALAGKVPEIVERASAAAANRETLRNWSSPEQQQTLGAWEKLLPNDALLVMDLNLCVKCDRCVEACESLHGRSRLVRSGMHVDQYLIPSACRNCDDPKCMSACPTAAVLRRPEGEIFFDYDLCIGCENCAIACPYDNIAMIDTESFEAAQTHKSKILHKPDVWRPSSRRAKTPVSKSAPPSGLEKAVQAEGHGDPPAEYPIKCDLCDGLPLMGCVHNCPTGAAIRIRPTQLTEEAATVIAPTGQEKAEGVGGEPANTDAVTGEIAKNSNVLGKLTKKNGIVADARKSPDVIGAENIAVAVTSERKIKKVTLPSPIPPWLDTVNVIVLAAVLFVLRPDLNKVGAKMGPFLSGAILLGLFGAAALYSARKRMLWVSVRGLLWASKHFPDSIIQTLRKADTLRTWKTAHVLIGMISIAALIAHVHIGRMSPVEGVLLGVTLALLASGIAGVAIQNFVPAQTALDPLEEVRLEDVEERLRELQKLEQAKDTFLGHGSLIEQAWRDDIRPILDKPSPRSRFLWAILTDTSPVAASLRYARRRRGSFQDKDHVYDELLELASRKVRLEFTAFRLRFLNEWLRFHIRLAMVVGVLVIFHVVSAIYFELP
jgi:Fe-S-cluster-containing dehydrogenase component/CRP-like cAMP-binding protein